MHQTPTIFVYGTLKRGFVNQPAMRGVGSDQIRPAYLRGFDLLELPHRLPGGDGQRVGLRPYPYPLLVQKHPSTTRPNKPLFDNHRPSKPVLGELHSLGASTLEPQDALRVLDHLELEGFEYHRRRWWATARGRRVRVWVYVYASRGRAARKHARVFAGVSWSAKKAKLGL